MRTSRRDPGDADLRGGHAFLVRDGFEGIDDGEVVFDVLSRTVSLCAKNEREKGAEGEENGGLTSAWKRVIL